MMRSSRTLRFAAMAILAAACTDSSGPGDVRLNPNFLAPALSAPPIANPVVSFWAKKGEDVEANMYYQKRVDRPDSTEFVRFRVRASSLLSRPDGSLIAIGDSVLITITLVDPERLIIDMQPAGLRFSPARPAELKLSFREADEDVNGDGQVNAADAAILPQFAIWKRERAGDPWMKLTSVVQVEAHEVEALVGGFTGYAIAW